MKFAITAAIFLLILKSCGGASGHVVSLRWTASTTPGVEYNMYRSLHGKNSWKLLNPSGFIRTTFNDTSVLAATQYDYQVTAEDAGGESARSNTFTITVP